MYVIGKNEYEFIKITYDATMYDGDKLWNELRSLEYDAHLNEATIISDYEATKKLLEEIQNHTEDIKFSNNSVIGEILDRDNSFNKFEYVKELKIYTLEPRLVVEKEE